MATEETKISPPSTGGSGEGKLVSSESLDSLSGEVTEAGMEDIIGAPGTSMESDSPKQDKSRRLSLKKTVNALIFRKTKVKETSEPECAEKTQDGKDKRSMSQIFPKVSLRPSLSKMLHPFTSSSSKETKEQLGSDKAGSSKTLGRLMSYMGKGKKDDEVTDGARTMTLGRRIIENFNIKRTKSRSEANVSASSEDKASCSGSTEN